VRGLSEADSPDLAGQFEAAIYKQLREFKSDHRQSAIMAPMMQHLGDQDMRDLAAYYARPHWAPPGWVFAPVWSVLYVLMGVAAWLVWRAQDFMRARSALILFVVQLIANALWSWVFFVWHQGGLAFAEVLLLWVLIVGTVVAFWRLNTLAAVLLLPYLAWVTFASALTFSIWKLRTYP
jgi:tryptophan-rich sensory protein